MTPTEINFLVWGCGILLSIIAFVGILSVKALMQMAADIGEIKITIATIDTKHDEIEKRVHRLEKSQLN